MKIEVTKAKAFEIDTNKHYLVAYETPDPLDRDTMEAIKEGIVEHFDSMGVKVTPVVVVNGNLKITEVKNKK